MKINRIINGQKTEIELTETELIMAYREEKRNCDRSEIMFYWDECDYAPDYEITDDQIDRAALLFREYLDENDTVNEIMWDKASEAITNVLREDGVELD